MAAKEMTIEERIGLVWPEANPKTEVMMVGPLGSRSTHNILLYWRTMDRVSTGMIGTAKGCFEGSLYEFELKLKVDYSSRVTREHISDDTRNLDLRRWDEYNLVLRFLKDLPKLD